MAEKKHIIWATGRRKTAVARVILKPGTGAYIINGKSLDEFFPRDATPQGSADMGPQLRRRVSERRQRRDGNDLPGAGVERRALVDFSIDRFEHVGCELRSHVAQRAFDLIRCLPENFTDFLCAARAALRV